MAEREDVLSMRERLRHISVQDFATLGVKEVVYIRPVEMADVDGFAVYGADGALLKFFPEYNQALQIVEDNDLRLGTVH